MPKTEPLALRLDSLDLPISRNESFDSEQSFWDDQISAMSAQLSPRGDGIGMDHKFSVSYHDLEVLNKIGFGSCSAVRLAVHKISGKKYAVKVFNVNDLAQAEQLKKEIVVLASLPDTNNALMTLQGLHHHEGAVSVILEYMDRGSVEHFIEYKKSSNSSNFAQGSSDMSPACGSPDPSRMVVSGTPDAPSSSRITETVIAAVIYQVLVGLNCLHSHRKVHRDVKPANILLNSSGYVKLSDFGISREAENENGSEPKSNLAYMGTCMYMSPERLLGLPYDEKADIWSAGIIALELWHEYPFLNCCGTPVDLLEGLDDFDFGRELAKLPQEMATTLAAMLQRDPSKRVSCDELLRSKWFLARGIQSIDEARLAVLRWLTASEDASPGRCMIPKKRSSFALDTISENNNDNNVSSSMILSRDDLRDVMIVESPSLSHNSSLACDTSFEDSLNTSVHSTGSVKKARYAPVHMPVVEDEEYYCNNSQRFCLIDCDGILKVMGITGSNSFGRGHNSNKHDFRSSGQQLSAMPAKQQEVQFTIFLKTIERNGYECTVYLQQKTDAQVAGTAPVDPAYQGAIFKRCDAVLKKKKSSNKVTVEINIDGKAKLFRFAAGDINQLGLGPGAAAILPLDTPLDNVLLVNISFKGELSLVFQDSAARDEVYRGLEVLIEAESNVM